MLSIVSLLANRWIEKNYRASYEVDNLLIDDDASLFIFVTFVSCTFSLHPSNSVLNRSPHVGSPYTIDPFQFNFDVIRLSHVVVYSLVFKTIGD